jgi:hypothetical protein
MNQDQQHPPMNGNDDLAKTLNEGLQFEETPMPGAAPSPAGNLAVPAVAAPAPSLSPAEEEDDMKMPSMDPSAGDPDNEPFVPPTLTPTPPVDEPKEDKPAPKVEHTHAKGGHAKAAQKDTAEESAPAPATTGDSELDGLKASALEELRPLVGKLNLPAEERFDTLLLIIRSTDDQSLLGQAHDAAKEITDDGRRAQALLDVIKEIDYFSSKR